MTRLRVTVGIYGEQVGYTTSGLNEAGIRHRVQQLLVCRLVESNSLTKGRGSGVMWF